MRTKACDLVGTVVNGFKIKDWKRESISTTVLNSSESSSGTTTKNGKKRTFLLAVCPYCQKEKWIRYDTIREIKSCGCYNIENNQKKPADIAGQRFGRLVAIQPTERRLSNGSIIWECKCDCGNITYASVKELTAKDIRSCGCLQAETRKENYKKAGKNIADKYCAYGTNINNLTANMRIDNKSGIKGVFWDRERRKWVAQIRFQGKNYYLGRYDNINDAAQVRKEAEAEKFGKFLEWYNSLKKPL